MFLRISTTRDGVQYAHIVQAYRDENGKSRQRIVERCGRLDVLLADDPDAVEHLKARAQRLTSEREAQRGVIEFDTAQPSDAAMPVNLGWLVADAVLERLGVTTVVKDAGRVHGWTTDVAGILSGLVAGRIICPCSKRATVDHAPSLFGGPTLDLNQTYRALDRIADLAVEIQHTASVGVGRTPDSLRTVDYDVTNYFFHIDSSDLDPEGVSAPRGHAKRRTGPSKEHRVDPILQMGLFCDSEGIPVWYRLFDGNVPDVSTLPTSVAEFKHAFHPGRVVVVGDKAMNARGNLGVLLQGTDGWIVSESARKTTATVRQWILDDSGWTWNSDHTVCHKSIPITRSVPTSAYGVDNIPTTTSEKLVVSWSGARAGRDRWLREQFLDQAAGLVADEARYRASGKHGARKYITAETVDTDTGEVTPVRDTHLRLDQAKIDTEAQMDGYTLIRTSEVNIPDEHILTRYHQLVQIEDAFRITKTDLHTRPVYVHTSSHMEAHFLTCFLALLVTRLLQRWTGLPTGQLLTGLRDFQAVPVGHGIHRLCRPAVWNQIDQATGVSLDHTWATLPELRQWRRDLTTAAKTATYTTQTTI